MRHPPLSWPRVNNRAASSSFFLNQVWCINIAQQYLISWSVIQIVSAATTSATFSSLSSNLRYPGDVRNNEKVSVAWESWCIKLHDVTCWGSELLSLLPNKLFHSFLGAPHASSPLLPLSSSLRRRGAEPSVSSCSTFKLLFHHNGLGAAAAVCTSLQLYTNI